MAARQISVQRFDADAGPEPYWQTYTVEMTDRQTLLDALLTIADRIDPTLAFRRTCRSGICGSCAGRVNGRACLLCQLSIGEAASGPPRRDRSDPAVGRVCRPARPGRGHGALFRSVRSRRRVARAQPRLRRRAVGRSREHALAGDELRDVRDLRAGSARQRISSSGCGRPPADPGPRPSRRDRPGTHPRTAHAARPVFRRMAGSRVSESAST